MSKQQDFEDLVPLKYGLYNGLFLTLPFSELSAYGTQLPFFAQHCEDRLRDGDSPELIVHDFLWRILGIEDPKEVHSILFLFLQLVERQVLLFDAIESAAYPKLSASRCKQLMEELQEKLKGGRSLRLVLTAHPTQFYPETLISMIKDLTEAVRENNPSQIRRLLLQLGYTSFKNPHPPTPFSEAEMLIEQFGPVFYNSFVDLLMQLEEKPQLELGFWPGGDRDGHPLVTTETTVAVAQRLRRFIIGQYLKDVEELRRKITFKGLVNRVNELKRLLEESMDGSGGYATADDFLQDLHSILLYIDQEFNGLHRDKLERLILAIQTFGFHFASLDIRQSSDVHSSCIASLGNSEYSSWKEEEKLQWLQEELRKEPDMPDSLALNDQERDLIQVLEAIPKIQKCNGTQGLHRFIISHTEQSSHLLEILLLCHWTQCPSLDIVPLFESIDDLQAAPQILENLFSLPCYKEHLKQRNNSQTIMLGFSDGTKDGGYATCNWEIQNCKVQVQNIAEKHGIDVTFFDGRGGPPGRGGGNTHYYYRSVAERLPLQHIQQTVQGQTISSYYGNPASAKHNLLELLAALTVTPSSTNRASEEKILTDIAEKAHQHYVALREHPCFLKLLEEATPLKFLGALNIASRPPKRVQDGELNLDNLRAIPFVGAWSLMKINIPAFYGLGYALEELFNDGKEQELQELADNSSYFQSLLGNASQALRKSYLPLTKYLADDPHYGELWTQIREETARSTEMILKLRRQPLLMADDPVMEGSIALREKIILPLLVIQHSSLIQWRQAQGDVMQRLIVKSIPPSINASRNSA